MPEWYVNQPTRLRGGDVYLNAFWNLSSCRQLGMGWGPIPWTAIRTYARAEKIPADQAAEFVYIIRQLDAEFLKVKAAEMSAKTPSPRPREE